MSDAAAALPPPTYAIRLLIAGTSDCSRRAVANLHRLCAGHLAGRFDLEVIDVFQRPELLEEYQIVAAPTLLKLLPLPVRRITGDLSREDRVLRGLDIVPG